MLQIFGDRFLERLSLLTSFTNLKWPRNFGNSEAKIKKIKKILDEYQPLSYDLMGGESQPNFQRLILDSLNRKFSEAKKIMAKKELDQILDSIVENSQKIEAIAIVNLKEGGLEYNNKQLKVSKPDIYKALFGRRDASDALGEFIDLKGIPNALNTFGDATNYGTLEYAMFYLTEGIVITYFLELPGLPVAICFIATQDAPLTPLIRQCRKNIDEVKKLIQDSLDEI